MLSSVLNSPQAIQINISIMRVFVKVREWSLNYGELALKIKELEKDTSEHHDHIAHIYQLIEELLRPTIENRPAIGFKK